MVKKIAHPFDDVSYAADGVGAPRRHRRVENEPQSLGVSFGALAAFDAFFFFPPSCFGVSLAILLFFQVNPGLFVRVT